MQVDSWWTEQPSVNAFMVKYEGETWWYRKVTDSYIYAFRVASGGRPEYCAWLRLIVQDTGPLIPSQCF